MGHRALVVASWTIACGFDASGAGIVQESIGSAGETTLETTSSPQTDSDAGDESPSSNAADTTGPAESTDATLTSADTTGDTGEITGTTSESTGGAPRSPWCDSTWTELVGCYAFADLAGGVLTDESAIGNHGAVAGVGIEAGPLGEAAVFSGDSAVVVPANPATDLPSSLTIELFARIDAIPSSERAGLIDRDSQWSIFLYADGRMRCGASEFAYWDEPTIGQWMHLGCVVGDGKVRLYVDGSLVAESDFFGPIDTGSPDALAIGDDSPSFDEPLTGAVSGVRLWSVPRTAEELCAGAGELCSS